VLNKRVDHPPRERQLSGFHEAARNELRSVQLTIGGFAVSHDDLCREGLCGALGTGRVVGETLATGELVEDLCCEERIGYA